MPVLAIALIASVAVDLSSLDEASREEIDAERLHGRLAVRLAEEGYGVRAASQASRYRLELSMPGRRVLVRAVGAEVRGAELEVGPRPVFHLGLIQRALLLLGEVPPAAVEPPSLPRAFVHFPAGMDEEAANLFFERAALSIIEDGFELIGSPDSAERFVCISRAGEPIRVPAGTARDDCGQVSPESPRPASAPEPALLRLLVDPGTLARTRSVALVEPGGPPAGDVSWIFGISMGALFRDGHVDPSLALHLSAGRGAGPFAAAAGRLSASETSAIGVVEAIAAAGPGWRFATGSSNVEISLLAGGFLHQLRYGMETYREWDWVLLAPFDVSLPFVGSSRLHAGFVFGIAEGPVVFPFIDEGPVTWSRGAFQITAESGVRVSL